MYWPNLYTTAKIDNDSGVHLSLHSNCHHQTVFAKLNLELVYPPPYVREVWHYKDANTELIRRAVNKFNWQSAFLNTNVNAKVDIFNSTVLNILSNFIPHEVVVCDDKEENSIDPRKKNAAFKNYCNNSSTVDLKYRLKYLEACLNASIEFAKW